MGAGHHGVARSTLASKMSGASVRPFPEFCEAIRDNPEMVDWYAEKGEASNGREFATP